MIKKKLTIVMLFFIIIFAPFIILLYSKSFHFYLYEKNGVASIVEHEKLEKITDEVFDFLYLKSDLIPSFNEQENQHMIDVRKFYNFILLFLFTSIIISSIFIRKLNLKQTLNSASFFVLIFIILMLLFSLFNFSGLFSIFHKTFFQEGTYSFDPSESLMKSIYPDNFFLDFLKISFGISLIISLIIMGYINRKLIIDK